MLLDIIMVIIGFVLLILGADLLIRGASNIAKKFHIPEMIIGLTIVALGTSAPELIITISSAKSGATDLIIGNAIGSNLCNLLLILGIMSMLNPIKIEKEAIKIHIPVALFSALITLGMGIDIFKSSTGVIDRNDGIILISMFLIYFTYPIFIEIKDIIKSHKIKETVEQKNEKNIIILIIFIVLGIILLKYGGDFVVNSSIKVAQNLKLSERVIGLTIIAIGTALPELVTSIVAVIKKDTDLAVGNLMGSCVLNLFLILGIGSIIIPLKMSDEFYQNLILLCSSTFIIWIFNFIGKKGTITRFKGFLLLLIYSIYFSKLFL